jgi:hypothetical protein
MADTDRSSSPSTDDELGYVFLTRFQDSLTTCPLLMFRNDRKLTQTYDVTTLADPLVAQDSLATQDAYNSIYLATPNLEGQNLYARLPEGNVRLSALKQVFEGNKASRALARLHQRSTLIIDDEYTVPTNHQDFAFSCNEHYLDFILVVGASRGLAMFIPHVLVDHTFSIQLNLRLHIKQFRAKHGTVGFNPTGAMWCVGQTRSEDLWIGMAPNEYFDDADLPFHKAKDCGDTRLTKRHTRIMQTFIVTLLTRLRGRQFEFANPYATDLTGTRQIASNVM